LSITAHPGDENNALLALLSRGDGYRTALLTLTRGAGGQNEIGSELFEALGVLRTEELMAVHRYDAVKQFFTRAYEFGYSFSVEETMQKWGRREILQDIVRVIREFRPSVVVTMNPAGSGGGQHHQASAQLAAEAFRMAGDPAQFPEQLEEGLRPWRPLRLFQSPGPGMGFSRNTFGDVNIELSTYDPLLGESYAEFGTRARSKHRSQGMNLLPQPGPASSPFILTYSSVSAAQIRDSFFDQVEVGLQALSEMDPGLESSMILLEGYIDWAQEAFSRSDYPSAVKAVMTGLDLVRNMRRSTTQPEPRFLLLEKEKDFLRAAEKGHFFRFDVLATGTGGSNVVVGEEFEVRVRLFNRSSIDTEINSVELLTPPGWEVRLDRSTNSSFSFKVTVPENTLPSQPFWFRRNPSVDRYEIGEGFNGTESVSPPLITARAVYESFGVTAILEKPAQLRWFDPNCGAERQAEIKVVPKLTVTTDPIMSIIRTRGSAPSRLKVTATNHSKEPAAARLSLKAPPGWTVSPGSAELRFSYEDQSSSYWFTIRPPAGVKERNYSVGAIATTPERAYSSGFTVISYPHIQTRHLYRTARSTMRVLDARMPTNLRVG
jgi:LmbE family N-acetylglucosaminyl deacetylase